jgi:predicted AlkP superfamily phosphohydrolase/phosphomutase
MGRAKLVFLGIDGADWRIVDPLVEEGCLPNFKRLLDEGTRARLRSTVPPVTAPAWRTIFSGVNPAKHGVFDFFRLRKGRIEHTSAQDNLMPYVWDLMSERTLAFNIPCSHPLKKTAKEIIVTGFATPSASCSFTRPEELKREILDLEPGYSFGFSGPKANLVLSGIETEKEGIDSSIMANLGIKLRVARHLLETKEWEAAFIVFSATDWMQHSFMHEFATSGRKSGTHVARPYIEIDRLLGHLMSEGHTIIVASDHGFREARRTFFPNTHLYRKGLIFPKSSPISGLLKAAGLSREKALAIFSRFDALWGSRLIKGLIRRLPGKAATPEGFDLYRTRAFLLSSAGGIFVSREESADRVSAILEQSRDEEGKKVVKKILRKEEVYAGPALAEAPDLILVPEDEVFLASSLAPSLSKKINPETEMSGSHDEFGIFIAWEMDLTAPKDLGELSVNDITPTVLAYFGYKIPPYMDGKPAPLFQKDAETGGKVGAQTKSSIRNLISKHGKRLFGK